MGQLFGTNGVRGVTNKDLTIEKVTLLVASAGSYLGSKIGIGTDGRVTSPMFKEAAIAGLMSVGCKVTDFGHVTTPALQYIVKNSHNPPEFNGVKVMASDGVEVSRQQENEIEDIYFNGGPELVQWDNVGDITTGNAIDEYCKGVISHVNVNAIKQAGLKIAVDPGNGVAALTAPRIAQSLGCQVNTVNVDIDGTFPNRSSEPRPDNLNLLQLLVKSTGSDLGIAFDGDGDRALFVDEKGEVYWGDKSFALVTDDFVKSTPGSKVATPVSSSQVIADIVSSNGGKVVWTEVGSVVVSRKMVNDDIMLGGEENGGIMYGPHIQTRDGSMAMALILDIMAREGKPLSELFKGLPQYMQAKDKVECPEDLKGKVLERLKEKADAPEVETIDGVKLKYPDGRWVLFRPSGTEPIFRIYAEADSQLDANTLVSENKRLIESVVEELTG